jgi:hypothetical protein
VKTHRQHPALTGWIDPRRAADLVRREYLAAARLEPITDSMRGGAWLDLLFVRGEDVQVIPLVDIAGEMFEELESSPFMWPHEPCAAIQHEHARAVERALQPWVESSALGRPLTEARTRFFEVADARDLFERAREYGFIGATSYDRVLRDTAPYVYAARFCADRRVAIADEQGALGAAILAKHALSVQADLGSAQRNEFARQWFGTHGYGSLEGDCDVSIGTGARQGAMCLRLDSADGDRIVDVASPIPAEIPISFDLQDAPGVRSFAVSCDIKRVVRGTRGGRSAAGGGSSGKILILVREDAMRAPDADTDDALELARRLRAEGFTVEVAPPSSSQPEAYDLVHAFVCAQPNEFLDALSRARQVKVPIVATAGLADAVSGGAWGAAIVRSAWMMGPFEEQLSYNLARVAARLLETETLNPKHHEPFAGYESALREVYAQVNVALVTGGDEEALLRRYGYSGPTSTVPTYLNTMVEPEPVETLAGLGDYVLVHAPIDPRCNQLVLVRAAREAGLPVVLAGPVADAPYYRSVLAFSDERVAFVAAPTPGELAALYRSARVFADASWIGYGLHRIARAAASGCALVVSSEGYAARLWGGTGLWQTYPGNEHDLSVALGDAWLHAAGPREAIDACAGRIVTASDPQAALVATAGVYARAGA